MNPIAKPKPTLAVGENVLVTFRAQPDGGIAGKVQRRKAIIQPGKQSPMDGEEWQCRVADVAEAVTVEPIKRIRSYATVPPAKSPTARPEPPPRQADAIDPAKAALLTVKHLLEDEKALARLHKALQVPQPLTLRDVRNEAQAVARTAVAPFDSVKQNVADLDQRVQEIDKTVDRLGRSEQDLPVPVVENHGRPTEKEIAQCILHHLVRFDAWGGRHTDGRHLRRGQLAKASEKAVEKVVATLTRRDYLLPHGKRPDEHYSLNPAKAAEIYQYLGMPDKHVEEEATRIRARAESRSNETQELRRQLIKEMDERFADEGKTKNEILSVRNLIKELASRLEHPMFRTDLETSRDDVARRLQSAEEKAVTLQERLARAEELGAAMAQAIGELSRRAADGPGQTPP